MNDFRMPECSCPACGEPLDAAMNPMGTGSPEPGNATICLYCGALAIFREDLSLRELTGKEMIEALKDERIAAIEQARQEVMKRRDEKEQ